MSILKRYARMVEVAFFTADLIVTILAFFFAYVCINGLSGWAAFGSLSEPGYYGWLLLFIVPVWAVLLQVNRVYVSHRIDSLGREAGHVLKVVAFGGLGLFALLALTKSSHISRPFMVVFLALDATMLILLRVSIRSAARFVRARGANFRTVLIVGTGERAKMLARQLVCTRHWGFRVVGHVSESRGAEKAAETLDFPVLGTVKDVPRLLLEYVVDEVIVAVSRERITDMESIFLHCEQTGINARLAVDFFPHRIARAELDDLGGLPMLTYTTTSQDAWALTLKRTLDVLGSALFLLSFSWLYALIAAAVKLTSKGPIFYSQDRIGINGRRFRFWKFRSMVTDAEDRLAELAKQNEMDGPVFKIRKDPRITPIGRILRKFSLDELPQMWNVLKGEMSLVGPRPPLPAEVDQYEPWARRRLSVRPGLTCLWQVQGRNEIGFKEWMELDLKYIDEWSLGLDFKILIKTVPVVLGGKGAS